MTTFAQDGLILYKKKDQCSIGTLSLEIQNDDLEVIWKFEEAYTHSELKDCSMSIARTPVDQSNEKFSYTIVIWDLLLMIVGKFQVFANYDNELETVITGFRMLSTNENLYHIRLFGDVASIYDSKKFATNQGIFAYELQNGFHCLLICNSMENPYPIQYQECWEDVAKIQVLEYNGNSYFVALIKESQIVIYEVVKRYANIPAILEEVQSIDINQELANQTPYIYLTEDLEQSGTIENGSIGLFLDTKLCEDSYEDNFIEEAVL